MAKWLLVLVTAATLFGVLRAATRGPDPARSAGPASGANGAIEPVRAVHATVLLLALLIVAYELFSLASR